MWIHFIAGDTSGHNNLIGHMNASNTMYPYHDCKCGQEDLSNPIPNCTLVTLDEMKIVPRIPGGLQALSKKETKNAFGNVPFGDYQFSILGSVPAELLHVSRIIILNYIFECLNLLIAGNKDKESFDDLHRCLVSESQCQSERDVSRMSIQNGITDGTKMCGSEQVGNCFILLCLIHTQLGQQLFSKY